MKCPNLRTELPAPVRGAVVCCLLLLVSHTAFAGQVKWYSSIFQTNLTSANAPMDEGFVFDLGAFDAGFVPSAGNTAQWAAKWHGVQRVFYNAETRFFTGDYPVASNAPPFGIGQRGYVWGYNCGASAGEWILLTADTWTWPAAGGIGLPVDWTVSAANAIVGQANGAGFHMKSASVAGSATPKLAPEEWRQMRFSAAQLLDAAVSGWTADPDRDGLPNLAEFGLGRHPLRAASTWAAVPGIHIIGPQSFLKLAVPKCAYSSAVLSIEAASDLQSWASDGEVEILSDTAALLEARDLTAIGTAPRRFLRLRVALP